MMNMKKKAAAMGLATVMAVSAVGSVALAETRTTYTDVAEGEWYYSAVDTVTNDLKLMSGIGGGQFGPKKTLTREQFVQVLYNMSGEKSEGYGEDGSKFTDVDTTAWYAPALAWAEANNVTSGTSATTFGTGKAVTREQMAVFMRNYCQQNDLDPVGDEVVASFGDADTASSWAKDAVEWSRKAGLFAGDENGNFNPSKVLTRAEAAQVMANFYNNAHDYTLTATKDAGCTTEGSETYTCKICHKTKTEAIAALGHSYDDGKVTKAATCTENGEMTYTCTVCGETKTEVISAAHSWNEGEVTKEATATEDGETTYTCTVCGETKVESHVWGKGEVIKAATCTEAGEITYTCTSCGETKTETVSATGHRFIIGVITKESTCIEEGEMTYTCYVCGATKTESIDKGQWGSHSYDDGTVTKEATCTEDGKEVFTCTLCGETRTKTIDALGHTWNDGVVTKEGTCAEGGEELFTCTVCGGTKTEAPHDWELTSTSVCIDEFEGVPGPVATDHYTCTVCGEKKEVRRWATREEYGW